MMSTSTLLFLITCGQFLLSVQGLTLRLKGEEIIPDGGEVCTTVLPEGGCRRYDTLECLSDVEYRGAVEKAYWKYTDPNTGEDHMVDDIHCKGDECKSPYIEWQSSRGIYRKGKSYYNVVRLGRKSKNAAVGEFTCYFEEDTKSPVSVNIIDYVPKAPIGINVSDTYTTISWDAPCGRVDYYTFYYDDGTGECYNATLDGDKISKDITKNWYEMQVATHRDNMTKCSPVYEVKENLYEIDNFSTGCNGYCIEEY